jgi:gentisate 1,2-dioxygenase
MNAELGRIEDLPPDYVRGLRSRNTLPLWPSLRAVLPYGAPARRTLPVLWRYRDIRPDLLRAGDLTPIERAERRVLVLCNPGLGLENMQATPTIYIGLQLIQPGETAPNHRHTPSAIRFVVEGSGGFTLVDGEKLPMERGDLILTPSGLWHEHGHEGRGPVIWLDALDLPLIYGIDASYCIEGRSQSASKPLDFGPARFRTAGVLPYALLDGARAPYPLLRFRWRDVREALVDLSRVTAAGECVHLAYVHPQTGRECLPTLGFSALMVRPGETVRLPRRSASAVLHVIEGAVTVGVAGAEHQLESSDTCAVPNHESVVFENPHSREEACVFMVDDAPLHRKLGIYETWTNPAG